MILRFQSSKNTVRFVVFVVLFVDSRPSTRKFVPVRQSEVHMNGETPVSVVDKHKQLSTDFFNASYLEAQSLLLRLYRIVLYGKKNHL